jgi:hypothetical protein
MLSGHFLLSRTGLLIAEIAAIVNVFSWLDALGQDRASVVAESP